MKTAHSTQVICKRYFIIVVEIQHNIDNNYSIENKQRNGNISTKESTSFRAVSPPFRHSAEQVGTKTKIPRAKEIDASRRVKHC